MGEDTSLQPIWTTGYKSKYEYIQCTRLLATYIQTCAEFPSYLWPASMARRRFLNLGMVVLFSKNLAHCQKSIWKVNNLCSDPEERFAYQCLSLRCSAARIFFFWLWYSSCNYVNENTWMELSYFLLYMNIVSISIYT